MITSWRITKAKHAATAFDGEGARRLGGRWNSPGTPLVYTSQSAALAALEMLVHLGKGISLPSYVVIPCTFDEGLVTPLAVAALPAAWRSYPAPPELQVIGDQWATSQRSVVLRVPSAVIDSEYNYLVNPLHPDFRHVTIGTSNPFVFDLRLIS